MSTVCFPLIMCTHRRVLKFGCNSTALYREIRNQDFPIPPSVLFEHYCEMRTHNWWITDRCSQEHACNSFFRFLEGKINSKFANPWKSRLDLLNEIYFGEGLRSKSVFRISCFIEKSDIRIWKIPSGFPNPKYSKVGSKIHKTSANEVVLAPVLAWPRSRHCLRRGSRLLIPFIENCLMLFCRPSTSHVINILLYIMLRAVRTII